MNTSTHTAKDLRKDKSKTSFKDIKTPIKATPSRDVERKLEQSLSDDSKYELEKHEDYEAPRLRFGPGQTSQTNESVAADRERNHVNAKAQAWEAASNAGVPENVFDTLIARHPENIEVLARLK